MMLDKAQTVIVGLKGRGDPLSFRPLARMTEDLALGSLTVQHEF